MPKSSIKEDSHPIVATGFVTLFALVLVVPFPFVSVIFPAVCPVCLFRGDFYFL